MKSRAGLSGEQLTGIVRPLFVIYIALNMAVCAILFFPWCEPRETVSGLMGRWKAEETGFKRIVGAVIAWMADRVYFWEPDHCVEVYRIEREARTVLYGKSS